MRSGNIQIYLEVRADSLHGNKSKSLALWQGSHFSKGVALQGCWVIVSVTRNQGPGLLSSCVHLLVTTLHKPFSAEFHL